MEYQFQGNQSRGSMQLKQQKEGITGSRMNTMSYWIYKSFLLPGLEVDTERNKLGNKVHWLWKEISKEGLCAERKKNCLLKNSMCYKNETTKQGFQKDRNRNGKQSYSIKRWLANNIHESLLKFTRRTSCEDFSIESDPFGQWGFFAPDNSAELFITSQVDHQKCAITPVDTWWYFSLIAGSFRVSLVTEIGDLWYLGNIPWHFYDK